MIKSVRHAMRDLPDAAMAARSGSWRVARAVMLAAAMATAFASGGCSTITDYQTVFRVPEGAPQRPETPAEYPAVHEIPATRQNALLEPGDQARIERELTAARDRNATGGEPQAGRPKKARKPSTGSGAED